MRGRGCEGHVHVEGMYMYGACTCEGLMRMDCCTCFHIHHPTHPTLLLSNTPYTPDNPTSQHAEHIPHIPHTPHIPHPPHSHPPTADLRSLASLVPAQTRMVLNPNPGSAVDDPETQVAMVPSATVRTGSWL